MQQFIRCIVLDIDGVLLRGSFPIKNAAKTIEMLQKNRFPFLLMTNGGGCREMDKATQVNKKLGLDSKHHVSKDQVLLCHTPFKDIAHDYKNQQVLVLGNEKKCKDVALDYGFSPIFPSQIVDAYPTLWPHSNKKSKGKLDLDIQAALIFHDPVDWSLEMQVLSDVLLGDYTKNKSNPNNEQVIPFYASNADLVYTTEHNRNRYTQGAFTEAFRCIFEQYTKTQLDILYCGKPFTIQYRYAEKQLSTLIKHLNHTKDSKLKFYAIGDNPLSDIAGANNAGDNWTSILVKTGVHTSQENDERNPADYMYSNVYDAVQDILNEKI